MKRQSHLKCTIEDCNGFRYARGWCQKHYERWYRNGDPGSLFIITPEQKAGVKCKVEGCTKYSELTGMCLVHYYRMNQFGRTHNIRNSAGEGSISSDGYKLVTINGRRVREHIYLAEKALGKSLPPGAIVHHMNGDKLDNYTPFNLIVCPNQAYHMFLHVQMRRLGYDR